MSTLPQNAPAVHGRLRLLDSYDQFLELFDDVYQRFLRRRESIFWRYTQGRLTNEEACTLELRAQTSLHAHLARYGVDPAEYLAHLRVRESIGQLPRVEPRIPSSLTGDAA